ncbi:MAG: adenylate/guanylate cyclase domain-containing protein, partial [Saprospiraceae bacterium]
LGLELRFKKGIGQTYNYRGVLEAIHANYSDAIKEYEAALKIRGELGDRKGVASLYNNIGNAQVDLGDYLAALDNFQQSLVIRKELQDTSRIARLYYNISLAHEALGTYPEALDYGLRYLDYAQRSEQPEAIARAYNQIGNIKTELGRAEEALEDYESALKLYQQLDDDRLLANAYLNIGNSKDDLAEDFYKNGNYAAADPLFDEALDYLNRSLALRKVLNDTLAMAECYNNFGYVYKNIGSYYENLGLPKEAKKNWKTALDYLYKTLKIREGGEDVKAIIETYNGISDVKRRQARYDTAIRYAKKYLALAQETNDSKHEQNAYEDLAKIYAAQKKYALAYDYRRRYDELRYQRLDEERARDNQRREIMFSDRQKQYQLEQQDQALKIQAAELREGEILQRSLIAGAIGLLVVLGSVFYNYRLKNRANEKLAEKNAIIEAEQQRSEELLLNILPAAVATELKQNGKAQARFYESATVLFTDFQAFTKIAEVLSPEELVAELDECFRTFDAITSRYGIEKIKTIGDSYMCVSGLPTPNPKHALDIVHAALDIRAYLRRRAKERKRAGKIPFKIRIGIHTGSVVAGIVGSKKFAYDIWGDTVNIASRMEEAGEVDKINISQATYEEIHTNFRCQHRGQVEVKHKEPLDMYFVE